MVAVELTTKAYWRCFNDFCNVWGSYHCHSLKKLLDMTNALRKEDNNPGATEFALLLLLTVSLWGSIFSVRATEELKALREKRGGTPSLSCVAVS